MAICYRVAIKITYISPINGPVDCVSCPGRIFIDMLNGNYTVNHNLPLPSLAMLGWLACHNQTVSKRQIWVILTLH